jgi:hypothetical protein
VCEKVRVAANTENAHTSDAPRISATSGRRQLQQAKLRESEKKTRPPTEAARLFMEDFQVALGPSRPSRDLSVPRRRDRVSRPLLPPRRPRRSGGPSKLKCVGPRTCVNSQIKVRNLKLGLWIEDRLRLLLPPPPLSRDVRGYAPDPYACVARVAS